jgi:hypothetical protein
MSLNMSRQKVRKKKDKLMIYIGRSVNLVSLETVLHIY